MARSDQLRVQRTGTVINVTSQEQEKALIKALQRVEIYLNDKFAERITLAHEKRWHLKDIVSELRQCFPDIDFHCHFDSSFMQPDGGFLFIKSNQNDALTYPILISEVKKQGTNRLRQQEGRPKQSKGNAIERLGKNVIGFRTALMRESIFPFVCFGYGCDFEEESTILDRVSTMAMFGELNETYLHNEEGGKFNRGSFYFRDEEWTVNEMSDVMKDIANRAILYYFSKYGEDYFLNS